MIKNFRFLILITFLVFTAICASAQGKTQKFSLSAYDNTGCRFKARSQDCPTKVMQDILARGKDAVPVLISQLTDPARTKAPIEDGWSYTESGDVAYIVLISLFTDRDGNFSLPDVPTWKAVMHGCNANVEGCWREYTKKNGRQSVQQAWMKAWNLHKGEIAWDAKERYFRSSKAEGDKD